MTNTFNSRSRSRSPSPQGLTSSRAPDVSPRKTRVFSNDKDVLFGVKSGDRLKSSPYTLPFSKGEKGTKGLSQSTQDLLDQFSKGEKGTKELSQSTQDLLDQLDLLLMPVESPTERAPLFPRSTSPESPTYSQFFEDMGRSELKSEDLRNIQSITDDEDLIKTSGLQTEKVSEKELNDALKDLEGRASSRGRVDLRLSGFDGLMSDQYLIKTAGLQTEKVSEKELNDALKDLEGTASSCGRVDLSLSDFDGSFGDETPLKTPPSPTGFEGTVPSQEAVELSLLDFDGLFDDDTPLKAPPSPTGFEGTVPSQDLKAQPVPIGYPRLDPSKRLLKQGYSLDLKARLASQASKIPTSPPSKNVENITRKSSLGASLVRTVSSQARAVLSSPKTIAP